MCKRPFCKVSKTDFVSRCQRHCSFRHRASTCPHGCTAGGLLDTFHRVWPAQQRQPWPAPLQQHKGRQRHEPVGCLRQARTRPVTHDTPVCDHHLVFVNSIYNSIYTYHAPVTAPQRGCTCRRVDELDLGAPHRLHRTARARHPTWAGGTHVKGGGQIKLGWWRFP